MTTTAASVNKATPNDVFKWLIKHKVKLQSFQIHQHKGADREKRWSASIVTDAESTTMCERCVTNAATILLGKGLVVCKGCYRSPEDVARDLSKTEKRQFCYSVVRYAPTMLMVCASIIDALEEKEWS